MEFNGSLSLYSLVYQLNFSHIPCYQLNSLLCVLLSILLIFSLFFFSMEHRRIAHGAAPPLTAVERFLYGQNNDALSTNKQKGPKERHPPIVRRTAVTEIVNDNKENTTFGPKKEKHLVVHGRSPNGGMVVKDAITKKRPYKNLIKGQWTTEEDRYITGRYMFMFSYID